ncbi:MAG: ankyrin repeat domain-containing protein [Thermocrispum sp.]
MTAPANDGRQALLDGGVPSDDVFHHACEHGDLRFLDLLYRQGFECLVNHKLDFEHAAGLQWFLHHGCDVNRQQCLHAPSRVAAGWASCGCRSPRARTSTRRGAVGTWAAARSRWPPAAGTSPPTTCSPSTAVDVHVLAIARGESTTLPQAPPPALGFPNCTGGYGCTEVVMLLVDLHDTAFDRRDPAGPTPLDCAVWGIRNNPATDGDCPGTVQALLAAGAPTRHTTPTGNAAVDALLAQHRKRP